MSEVTAANLTARTATLDDGRTLPITTFLDAEGDETDDLDEAVAFVCGAGGEWYAELLANFRPLKLH